MTTRPSNSSAKVLTMSTRRLRMLTTSALAVAAGVFCIRPAHADATISVIAGYDYASPTYVGNTFFEVVNNTASALTSISFTAVGDGAAGTSDTALWTWSGLSIAAGSTATLYFGDSTTTVTGTGYGFTSDYQFTLAGNDQTYQLSGTENGQTYTITFSPTANATGGFVAFLGNDASGDSLPSDVSATVGSLAVSAVPEPATWALALIGIAALGGSRRFGRA